MTSFFEKDKTMVEHNLDDLDHDDRVLKYTAWNHPRNNISGVIPRSEKLAGTVEKVTGELLSV